MDKERCVENNLLWSMKPSLFSLRYLIFASDVCEAQLNYSNQANFKQPRSNRIGRADHAEWNHARWQTPHTKVTIFRYAHYSHWKFVYALWMNQAAFQSPDAPVCACAVRTTFTRPIIHTINSRITGPPNPWADSSDGAKCVRQFPK